MARGWEEQMRMTDLRELTFEERFGLLVDGRYGKVLAGLARMDLLLIDDWGLVPLDDHGRRDILEILEDRHDVRSTIVTGQLPVSGWHEMIGDPTLADAILDRLVHNAHKIELKGESMRKILKSLTQPGHSGT
jgi:DNA replication protein DnaC